MRQDQLAKIENDVNAYMAEAVERAGDPAPYALKQAHTFRVCGHIRMLARSLDLSGDIRNRAAAAALLHDLGRFPQYRQFGTFSDPLSRNHAALSAGVVRCRRLLDGISRDEKRVILRAVALHNWPDVPTGLAGDLDLMARLLRDADKMDIFKVMTDLYTGPENGKASFITHDRRDDGRVSAALAAMVAGGRRLPYDRIRSLNDMKLFQLSMIYDINFPAALAHIQEHGVVPAIIGSMLPDNLVPDLDLLASVETALNRYMADRLGQ